MKALRKLFATDKTKETDGVKVTYGDLVFYIARAGGANKQFATVLEEKTRPYRRMIVNEVLPEETASQLLKETYAETIVKGLQDPDGGTVLGPAEIVAEFNNDEYGQEFYDFVKSEATRLSNFKLAEREDGLKN